MCCGYETNSFYTIKNSATKTYYTIYQFTAFTHLRFCIRAGIYGQVLTLDRDPLVAIGSESNTRPMRAKLLAKKGMASLDK